MFRIPMWLTLALGIVSAGAGTVTAMFSDKLYGGMLLGAGIVHVGYAVSLGLHERRTRKEMLNRFGGPLIPPKE